MRFVEASWRERHHRKYGHMSWHDASYRTKPCGVFVDVVESMRYFFLAFFHTHIYFPASGQALVTGVAPSPPRFLHLFFIAHRVQQSHCSSIFHKVLLTHALALSASQFVHKEKVPTNLYEYALGGIRTHETDLYQVQG